MQMRSSSKSALFLIEMIIAIGFFSVSAAVCTSLFVKANMLSQETRRMNMAVIQAQSVAECFKSADGSLQETVKLLDVSPNDGQSFLLYFNNDWQRGEQGRYRMTVSVDESALPATADIAIVDMENSEAVLYTMQVKQYSRELSGRDG
ncbi:hypothetical protein LJC63_02695 [Ruminococcaceae bacterium OttesenSCG-928-L11]|nr:hypothetical protein [Ruminococcaceae bacterium OttesenSCG-928-L11]